MQVLSDISDVVVDPDYWMTHLQQDYPPGSLVRITAPGHLFDSRYVAQTFSNFTAAAAGLQNLGVLDVTESRQAQPCHQKLSPRASPQNHPAIRTA
jgi:hypothetical protein